MVKKTWRYFRQIRIDVFNKRMTYKIVQAQREDLAGIVNIDRALFPDDLEMTLTPAEILFWFEKKGEIFRVAKTPKGDIIGFNCIVPLSESGSRKMLEEGVDSFQDLNYADIDNTGSPRHVHIEVIAALNPQDINLAASLLRDAIRQIPDSCETISAAPITQYGQSLIDRLRFRRAWKASHMKDGYYHELYTLDLTDPQVASRLRRFSSMRW
jgi:hypothetical protein